VHRGLTIACSDAREMANEGLPHLIGLLECRRSNYVPHISQLGGLASILMVEHEACSCCHAEMLNRLVSVLGWLVERLSYDRQGRIYLWQINGGRSKW
jgi:hypothetical protein